MNEHLQELKAGGRPKRKWEIELEDKDKEIERLKTELQDTKEHLGEYLHEQEEENNRLNNIINNAKDNIEELKDRAKEVSWVEMRSEAYCEELDSIFELRGDKE